LEALEAEASSTLIELWRVVRWQTFGDAVGASREGDYVEILLRERAAAAPFPARLGQEATTDERRVALRLIRREVGKQSPLSAPERALIEHKNASARAGTSDDFACATVEI
jgi:hypothetical protein